MPRKTKQNSITSPEKTAQINKDNIRLKDDFLIYLKSIQRSPGTISGYDNDLLIVFTYILDHLGNKSFSKLTKRDLISLQNWLGETNGNSPARVKRIKAAISSLSNYVENILADDDPEFNGYRSIVRKVENPSMRLVREKTVWADEELEDLLDRLVEKKKYEKACFTALAMYGGRRKSELCRFKVSDFAEDKVVCDGALYKSSPILTKGNKYLECYTLKKRFDPYLELWLNYRKQYGIESEWLFPRHDDFSKQLESSTPNSWATTFSKMTGKDFYFHSLRHYYVTALVRAGIPDSVIVDIVGWTSAEMLRIYNDTPKDEQIGRYFKNGDINVPRGKGLSEI